MSDTEPDTDKEPAAEAQPFATFLADHLNGAVNLTALYAVTEDALLKEGSVLDHENLVTVEAGCLDCEQPYGHHQRYCPAPAYTGFD